MPTLLLRILLVACAVSGSLVFACSEDAAPAGNSGGDDDDDSDDDSDDDDDTPPKKDAGRDAGKDAGKPSGRDSGAAADCTPGMCSCADGMMGVRTCITGSECMCAEVTGELGEPIDTCPGDLTCGRVLGMGPFCLGAPMPPLPTPTPPACPESKDCMDLDLPGAQCVVYGAIGSFCTQPCVLSTTPAGDAGQTGGGGDAGGGRGDAGGSSATDAGRDAGRDR